jgi:DNA-binding response OmpR family regulator
MIGRRILVVEDEYMVAEDLRRWLLGRGAEVVGPASRVGRARSLIATEPIDAAVLDIHLAGELVFPAAEALGERRIPFLFMSGFDRSVIPARFAHVQLLEKPVSFDAFLQAMTVLLSG